MAAEQFQPFCCNYKSSCVIGHCLNMFYFDGPVFPCILSYFMLVIFTCVWLPVMSSIFLTCVSHLFFRLPLNVVSSMLSRWNLCCLLPSCFLFRVRDQLPHGNTFDFLGQYIFFPLATRAESESVWVLPPTPSIASLPGPLIPDYCIYIPVGLDAIAWPAHSVSLLTAGRFWLQSHELKCKNNYWSLFLFLFKHLPTSVMMWWLLQINSSSVIFLKKIDHFFVCLFAKTTVGIPETLHMLECPWARYRTLIVPNVADSILHGSSHPLVVEWVWMGEWDAFVTYFGLLWRC